MRDGRSLPIPPEFNLEAHRRAHGTCTTPEPPTNSTLLFDTVDGHARHRIRAYIRADEMLEAKSYVGNLQISKDGGTTPLTPYRRKKIHAKDDDDNTTFEIPMGLVRKGWKVRYRVRTITDCRGSWGPGTSLVEADAIKGWSVWFDPDDTEAPPPVTQLTLDVDEHRCHIRYLIPDDPLNADADDPRIAHEWIELWRDALDSGTLEARDRHHRGEHKSFKISKPHDDTFFARVYTVSATGVKSTAVTTSATKNTPSQPAAPTVVFQGSRNRAVKVTPATVSPTDADIDTHIIEVVTMSTHTTPGATDDGDVKRVDADPVTGAPERSARFTKLPGGEWVYARTRVKDTQRRRSAWSSWTDAGQAGADDDTPTGIIRKFSGAIGNIPPGYLHCNGQAVSRSTYADLNALYSAAAYPYGNGDGSTTFNVPDHRGRHGIGVGTAVALGGNEGAAEASRGVSHDHGSHQHNHDHGSHGHNHDHGSHGHSHSHGTHHHTHNHGSHAHSHSHSGGGDGIHTHGAGTLVTGGADNGPASGGSGTPTDLTRIAHTHTITGDTSGTGSGHSHQTDATSGTPGNDGTDTTPTSDATLATPSSDSTTATPTSDATPATPSTHTRPHLGVHFIVRY